VEISVKEDELMDIRSQVVFLDDGSVTRHSVLSHSGDDVMDAWNQVVADQPRVASLNRRTY
jgi:hypothetical protein